MSEFFYDLFPRELLMEIAKARGISATENLVSDLQSYDDIDFWSTKIASSLVGTVVEIKALMYLHGFCNKNIPENHYRWISGDLDASWKAYHEFWLHYGTFKNFPPVLETPVGIPTQLAPMGRQMLLVKGIPSKEIDQLSDLEVLRIVETGHIPADLAQRCARILCFTDLLTRLDPEYQLEAIQALNRIYGTVENFVRTQTPNRWEQVLLRIDQLNSQQLACVTRVVFPEKLEKSLAKFPAVWRHRIYLMRMMPVPNDPQGEFLDFQRFQGFSRNAKSWNKH